VPAVVLADRMAGLRAQTVADLVVPHPDDVRFATRYGFRPDFCQAADRESKGMVENLVGYAQSDLLVGQGPFATLAAANAAASAWCAEVNARPHAEICAVPEERLARERAALRPLPALRPPLRSGVLRKVDRLSCVRFGSARYSVPYALVGRSVEVIALGEEVVCLHDGGEVARHPLVAPGEVSLCDEHYGGPARVPPRALRPRSAAERAFLGLGAVAERYLRAAAAGTPRLTSELATIVDLEGAYGREALLAALERALTFRRFPAADVRAILEAGILPTPSSPGAALPLGLPAVERRPLHGLRPGGALVSAPATLAPDLEVGLKRLKLRRMRELGGELLQTAKVQRWTPEELLRTLIEAEIAARDEANLRARLHAAGFPAEKRLDDFQVGSNSIPPATFAYLASLEWIAARENVCLIGPAGTGKTHVLLGCGLAAVEAGLRVRYLRADELIETLFRGLADNSVGRVIEGLLRCELIIVDEIGFAPLDEVGNQLFFRFVAAAYERRSLGVASHWPFEEWGRFLPEHTTATALLDRLLHHAIVVVTSGESYRMREARQRGGGRSAGAD